MKKVKAVPAVTQVAVETRDWLAGILGTQGGIGKVHLKEYALKKKRARNLTFDINGIAYEIELTVLHGHWQPLDCPLCDTCDGTGREGRKFCKACKGVGFRK